MDREEIEKIINDENLLKEEIARTGGLFLKDLEKLNLFPSKKLLLKYESVMVYPFLFKNYFLEDEEIANIKKLFKIDQTRRFIESVASKNSETPKPMIELIGEESLIGKIDDLEFKEVSTADDLIKAFEAESMVSFDKYNHNIATLIEMKNKGFVFSDEVYNYETNVADLTISVLLNASDEELDNMPSDLIASIFGVLIENYVENDMEDLEKVFQSKGFFKKLLKEVKTPEYEDVFVSNDLKDVYHFLNDEEFYEFLKVSVENALKDSNKKYVKSLNKNLEKVIKTKYSIDKVKEATGNKIISFWTPEDFNARKKDFFEDAALFKSKGAKFFGLDTDYLKLLPDGFENTLTKEDADFLLGDFSSRDYSRLSFKEFVDGEVVLLTKLATLWLDKNNPKSLHLVSEMLTLLNHNDVHNGDRHHIELMLFNVLEKNDFDNSMVSKNLIENFLSHQKYIDYHNREVLEQSFQKFLSRDIGFNKLSVLLSLGMANENLIKVAAQNINNKDFEILKDVYPELTGIKGNPSIPVDNSKFINNPNLENDISFVVPFLANDEFLKQVNDEFLINKDTIGDWVRGLNRKPDFLYSRLEDAIYNAAIKNRDLIELIKDSHNITGSTKLKELVHGKVEITSEMFLNDTKEIAALKLVIKGLEEFKDEDRVQLYQDKISKIREKYRVVSHEKLKELALEVIKKDEVNAGTYELIDSATVFKLLLSENKNKPFEVTVKALESLDDYNTYYFKDLFPERLTEFQMKFICQVTVQNPTSLNGFQLASFEKHLKQDLNKFVEVVQNPEFKRMWFAPSVLSLLEKKVSHDKLICMLEGALSSFDDKDFHWIEKSSKKGAHNQTINLAENGKDLISSEFAKRIQKLDIPMKAKIVLSAHFSELYDFKSLPVTDLKPIFNLVANDLPETYVEAFKELDSSRKVGEFKKDSFQAHVLFPEILEEDNLNRYVRTLSKYFNSYDSIDLPTLNGYEPETVQVGKIIKSKLNDLLFEKSLADGDIMSSIKIFAASQKTVEEIINYIDLGDGNFRKLLNGLSENYFSSSENQGNNNNDRIMKIAKTLISETLKRTDNQELKSDILSAIQLSALTMKYENINNISLKSIKHVLADPDLVNINNIICQKEVIENALNGIDFITNEDDSDLSFKM